MRKATLTATLAGLTLVGIAWLAEAQLHNTQPSPHLVYNAQDKVYQLHEQTRYANQSLEHKMLTVQSINRHERLLAATNQVASH